MKHTFTNTSNLKALNVDLIREILRNHEEITKAVLSQQSGLSIATCGNILREMIESNEVFEIETAKSTGGRPAKRYLYNKDYKHILSLYVRRELNELSIAYQITNLFGEIIDEHLELIDTITVDTLTTIIQHILIKKPSIQIISIGLPGVINNGYVSSCDIASFEKTDLTKKLQATLELPIVIENDVNCTVLGFYNQIQHNKDESTVYIYYPSDNCLGSGIIINGKLYYGMSHYAGEVGFLPFDEIRSQINFLNLPILDLAQIVAKTLMTYICTINPKNLVLSGRFFNENVIDHVKQHLNTICPLEHQPTIYYEKDIKDNYLFGLYELALNRLTCNIQITQKY